MNFCLKLLILGLTITIAAIVIYLKYYEAYESMFVAFDNKLVEDGFQWLTVCIVILGFAIFLITLVGCWGFVTGNKFLLVLYSILLLALIGGKLFLVIQFNNFDKIKTPFKDYLEEKFDSKTDNTTFHLVEYALHCCGTDGPASYLRGAFILPPSCCAEKITNITNVPDYFTKISQQIESLKKIELDLAAKRFSSDCSLLTDHTESGCIKEINDIIDENGDIIIDSMIVIMLVEIIETAAALYFCMEKSQKNKKAYY